MPRPGPLRLAAIGGALVAIALLLAVRAALVEVPLDRLTATPDGARVRHEGSWWFPRGGPAMIGFESPGPAELTIDGAVVVAGTGIQSGRRVLGEGAHAVRFVAPAGARLMWEPVGRRGPSEYVSPSSLAPGPPGQARFDAPGTARLDGAVAAGLLLALVVLIAAAVGARPRLDRAAAAVFALALLVRLVDLGGAGQTWDEDTNWSAGRNYVTNVLAGDGRDASWRFNLEHPPLSKYLYGIGAQLADGYGPARATAALLLALACALLVPIGRRTFGARAGVLAGVVAALTPHLIAHGRVVGHEAPTALAWAAAVLLCLRAHDGGARGLPARLAGIGAVLGLALSIRFVNGLLAPLIGLLLVLGAPRGARARTVGLGLAIVPAVAVLVAIAIWPRLWHAPLAHLAEAWRVLAKPHGAEPWLGALTRRPGAGYFPLYLLATAPLGVLVAALGGGVRAARRRERAGLVALLWLAVPLAVAVSPVRQDGVRYLIPSLLALALLAGAGLDAALDAIVAASAPPWLARLLRPGPIRRLELAAGAVVVLVLVAANAGVHPYPLDFYGAQVGGAGTVATRRWFETAWWGEGLDRAVAHVNAHAAPGAPVHKACVEPGHLAWLRTDLWAGEVRRAEDAAWIIVYAPLTRPCRIPADATLALEVRADGAPLARVYRR